MNELAVTFKTSTIDYVKDYREISSDDEKAWKLTEDRDWKCIVLLVSFCSGVLGVAALLVFR